MFDDVQESINVLTEKVARGYYTFLSPWWDDISASCKHRSPLLENVRLTFIDSQGLDHPSTLCRPREALYDRRVPCSSMV